MGSMFLDEGGDNGNARSWDKVRVRISFGFCALIMRGVECHVSDCA